MDSYASHTVGSSVSDSFCAREPGPKSTFADSTRSSGCKGASNGERKESSFVWHSLRLVGPGSACWNRLCSSRHMAVTASNSRVRSNPVPLWRVLRRYGDEGADQNGAPGGLVRPLSWVWTWIWTWATDCLVVVRPIYQPQTSIAGPQ